MNGYRLQELKVEVSQNCPLDCIHCSSNSSPSAKEHLDCNSLLSVINQFAYLGGEKLCISGGEPLRYKELEVLIKACTQKNINTTIYTTGIINNNGSMDIIPYRTAALLAQHNVKVIFSLLGASDIIHDYITRIPGSFKATLNAIEKVLSLGIEIEIHFVPMAINFCEIADVASLASSFNINKISWLRFVPQGRGAHYQDILRLTKEQLTQILNIKDTIQQKYPRMEVRTGSPFNILCPENPASCNAGINVITIGPDGSISPCDAFKRFNRDDEFGNVLKHNLSDIWEKSSFLRAIRMHHKAIPSATCSSCELYPSCMSGCLAQKLIKDMNLNNSRDPECLLGYIKAKSERLETVSI